MSVTLSVELGGRHVPLRDCDWVLWGPCGCPLGVTVGATNDGGIMQASEDAAWKAFYDRKRDIERAPRRGEHLELMTHECYCAEVSDRMLARCEHGSPA